jgi:hypothetical protein
LQERWTLRCTSEYMLVDIDAIERGVEDLTSKEVALLQAYPDLLALHGNTYRGYLYTRKGFKVG